MNTTNPISCLFVDIGGVLLTDGWPSESRKLAAKTFNIDPTEMEERHRLVFEPYEAGKFTLEEYLDWVVFYQERAFGREQFQQFMFEQSKPYPNMINLIIQLKAQYALKVFVVSNEARTLNGYRISEFKLDQFVDAFISSSYVHLRKPDPEIFRLALDIAQVSPQQVVYLENTPMFIQIAEEMGIHGVLHTDYRTTCDKLALMGLGIQEKAVKV